MSAHKQDFIQLQYEFAAHIRNPELYTKPDGVDDRRMNIYRELFFNNIDGFISGGFPVLKSITSEENWTQMVRTFFDSYRCHTPLFLEIAGEFVNYVNEHREPQSWDHPFMQELVHYEWVELALDTSEASADGLDVDAEGDLLAQHPVQSPLAWSLMYAYPVHRISVANLPQEAPEQPTFLVVYRNQEDRVKFMEINQLTARLLFILSETADMSGRDALEQIAAEMAHPDPEVVVQGGLTILQQLRDTGIILGTQ